MPEGDPFQPRPVYRGGLRPEVGPGQLGPFVSQAGPLVAPGAKVLGSATALMPFFLAGSASAAKEALGAAHVEGELIKKSQSQKET